MISLSLNDWVPRRPGMCAQINIDRSQIEALGGVINSPESEAQETDICILRLRSGRIVALARVYGNVLHGYTLMSMEEMETEEALREFMDESGLDPKLVIWVPEDS